MALLPPAHLPILYCVIAIYECGAFQCIGMVNCIVSAPVLLKFNFSVVLGPLVPAAVGK